MAEPDAKADEVQSKVAADATSAEAKQPAPAGTRPPGGRRGTGTMNTRGQMRRVRSISISKRCALIALPRLRPCPL